MNDLLSVFGQKEIFLTVDMNVKLRTRNKYTSTSAAVAVL